MSGRSKKPRDKPATRPQPHRSNGPVLTKRQPGVQINAPQTKHDASATHGRSWGRFGIVVAVAALLALLWPQVSLLFSPARSAIDVLRADSVYIEPGVTGIDAAQIRGVIGTRPIIAMVVNEGGPLYEDRADVCADVADYFDDVIVVVIAGGEVKRGCQGNEIALEGLESIDDLDIRLWLVAYPRLIQFLDSDPTAQVEQLALLYDKLVRIDDLHEQVRTFEAGPTRYALASVLAAAVIAAGATGYLLLRRVVGAQVRRADRKSGWRGTRDDLNLELTEIGLRMVQASPAEPDSQTGIARTLAEMAPAYLTALTELEAAESGSDLSDLTERVEKLEKTSRALSSGRK